MSIERDTILNTQHARPRPRLELRWAIMASLGSLATLVPIEAFANTPAPAAAANSALCGKKVTLKSWKGDYLHRPDTGEVTSGPTGAGSVWSVECKGDKLMFKSAKGDYLHRPDKPQGVTTWNTGAGNEWVREVVGGKDRLKSWKGDYLHRPDQPQGVTSWNTGTGNDWVIELVP